MQSHTGWREVPCVECGAFVEGIAFVQRCAACQKRRTARAAGVARLAALVGTLLMAAWVYSRGPTSSLMQWTAVAALPLTYVLIRSIALRVAMEVLP